MRALVEGVVAGLGIAVPVGAIAVLIVDLAMRRGFARAVPAAMGAASADLAYAAVAAVAGLAVAAVLAPYERGIELMSATVLAGIVAYRMVRLFRAGEDARPSPTGDGAVSTYAGFLALTLVNPLTIAYFAALILGLGEDTLARGLTRRCLWSGPSWPARRGSWCSRGRERCCTIGSRRGPCWRPRWSETC